MGVFSRVANGGLAGPAKCPRTRDAKGYPYARTLLLLALFFAGAERSQADVVLLVEQGPSIYRQAALGFERAFAKLDDVVQVEVDERLELVSLPRSFDPNSGSLEIELRNAMHSGAFSVFSRLVAESAYRTTSVRKSGA